MICPKRNEEMEKGYLLDSSYGGARKAVWVRGNDLPTIKISAFPPAVEITGEQYQLDVYRCTACGLVETCATEQV
ncbi:hypothetical protein Enr10x_02430 [Gimesia panareensis]|uniref:DUF6487 domain-containing protein n=1 Tax=Gimesia panareensis TaxID=2527978 RepID=A0A517PZY9_9PLAN|nr:PF20097 family protein [Gimesia panareensis]QDT24949.1 hypothetical protein Enr10x_02430 [Gimesia panareensis]